MPYRQKHDLIIILTCKKYPVNYFAINVSPSLVQILFIACFRSDCAKSPYLLLPVSTVQFMKILHEIALKTPWLISYFMKQKGFISM